MGALVLGAGGCVDGSPTVVDTEGRGTGASSSSGPIVEDVTGPPPPVTTSTTTTSTSGPGDTTSAEGSSTGTPGCVGDCPEHPLDVVFVVDNSRTMATNQLRLALAAEILVDELTTLEAESGRVLDLHLMVTTSDFGNPQCTPFKPEGYDPARGRPVSTACLDRLQDFTPVTGFPMEQAACTDNCAASIAPSDPYIAAVGEEDNVPGGTVEQALQCLLPQGVNGCGYESPLENMLQALNPAAEWNQGPAPFLRDGADLALVLLTDEMDCSVRDFSIMNDPSFMNVSPGTGMPSPSSAICWNAGIDCDGPDAMGVYTDCVPNGQENLQPIARYTDYLVSELAENQGKDVMMLTLVGIPEVSLHSTRPPFEPTLGGVDDLVIHDWIDGPYPGGEILPEEWAVGIDAADKTFQLGIGPGCTQDVPVHGIVQAQPPPRIREVCQALDEQGGTHCCMESICDDDLTPAMRCLRGMIQTSM
ncbi:MAG: hypothetical protein AB1Z98_12420 [Nannocystaceae bacterium]